MFSVWPERLPWFWFCDTRYKTAQTRKVAVEARVSHCRLTLIFSTPEERDQWIEVCGLTINPKFEGSNLKASKRYRSVSESIEKKTKRNVT